jgi:ribosomal protein S18 acetylase RimI-like enzyme
MNDTIRTREFLINDYESAVELWKRVEGLEIAEGDDKESVVRFLTRNPGLSRVATDGSVIVGVSLCGHDGRRGHIYHLAVDPKYQGVGLGKRLVEECFAGLRDAGIERAIILVAKDNPRGREFWLRCGWEELPGAMAMGKDVIAPSPRNVERRTSNAERPTAPRSSSKDREQE